MANRWIVFLADDFEIIHEATTKKDALWWTECTYCASGGDTTRRIASGLYEYPNGRGDTVLIGRPEAFEARGFDLSDATVAPY